MSRLKLLLIYLFFTLLISSGFSASASDQILQPQDALQQFRILLSQQLNPNNASIERVFNPAGEGEALLVRTYKTSLQELVFRPLIDDQHQTDEQDSFILRTLPNTELAEVLISFDKARTEYLIYFGKFEYSVQPNLSIAHSLRVSPEALPFLAHNFQTLFIDQPLIGLAAKYLHQQQCLLNQPAMLQLKREYRDSLTGQLLVNGEGDILNRYRFAPYEALRVRSVYFLEQSPFGSNQSTRYYIQDNGLQSYQVNEFGLVKPLNWLPLQAMRSAIEAGYELEAEQFGTNKTPTLD